ncbi:MAG: hypothetical protein O2856_17130 [Planctomycetota bacterium]|nr:hypothetical protein [Planctomycetota bacterium]
MVRFSKLLFAFIILAVLLAMPTTYAQSSRKEKDKDDKDGPNSLQLEIRLSKAEEGLLKEYMDVAKEYLKNGDNEEALTVLKKVQHINPKMDGLKQEMERINEVLMQDNDFKFELDVSKYWGSPICEVTDGKAFRLTAVGDYKMIYSTQIPLTGLPTKDPALDHVSVGPFGALIGVIVTDGKPGEPFVVNGSLEYTPKKGGLLYLRVNVPAAAKCSGDIKIQMSGAVKPLVKKR